jgi:hypothetical protein
MPNGLGEEFRVEFRHLISSSDQGCHAEAPPPPRAQSLLLILDDFGILWDPRLRSWAGIAMPVCFRA